MTQLARSQSAPPSAAGVSCPKIRPMRGGRRAAARDQQRRERVAI